ncbi:hypothetical protein CCACVL1_07323, partial [Corchorus capsularis]
FSSFHFDPGQSRIAIVQAQ